MIGNVISTPPHLHGSANRVVKIHSSAPNVTDRQINHLDQALGELVPGYLYRAEPTIPPAWFQSPTDTAQPSTWQDGTPAQTGQISPRHPFLKYTGRILPRPGQASVAFTWSGTQIEARFHGPSVAIHLEAENHCFNIVIDGDFANMRAVRVQGRQLISLAEDLPDGAHDLFVFLRTSVVLGPVGFHGLSLAAGCGLAPPPPRPTRRIEFIGDSITSGQAAGMPEGYHGPETGDDQNKDNVWLAYSSLTALALGAEAHYIAWPGIAMASGRGYTGAISMPAAWLKTLPTSSPDFPDSPNWDSSAWQPHVVVINLLQNDQSADPVDNDHLSRDAYLNFLKAVLHRYGPGVPILCVAGNMSLSSSAFYKQALADAVASFRTDTAHPSVATLIFAPKTTGGHPRISEHRAMADNLIPAIRQIMGW